MELFHNIPHINFMAKRHIMAGLSVLAFALSLFFIVTKGINFGLDFTGGTQLELRKVYSSLIPHILFSQAIGR